MYTVARDKAGVGSNSPFGVLILGDKGISHC
jgi:hypothetical protein